MENNEFNLPESNKENNENQQPLPRLYSEEAIMGFAFFCSTIFAGFLVVENFKEANARKGIIPVIIFTVIYMTLESIIVGSLPIQYKMFALVFNLVGGTILNLFFSKKYMPADLVSETKPIRKPLSVALILTAIFLLLNGLAGMAMK